MLGTLPDGRPVDLVEIGEPPGPVLQVLTLGATMHRLWVRDAAGDRRNVVLGHPDVATYLASPYYLGPVVGRYANRIAHGRLEVDGHPVQVPVNDRGHALHGGPDGFDRRLWEVLDGGADRVVLGLTSPDGDMGFPGTLRTTATYVVSGDAVRLDLEAVTDRPTVVNLTSHAYLNLDGAGTIEDHRLQVPASRWTPVDETAIPTGDHQRVDATPFDLRTPAVLGPRIAALPGGYDHNLVVDGSGLRPVAALDSPTSGIRLELLSDQPGLQVFTSGTFEATLPDAEGRPLPRYAGVALEPQLFPDSPHHPEWPSPVLRPGETYRSTIVWSFTTSTA